MAASALTVVPAGANNDILFTAKRDSVVFNTVGIEYLNNGASKSLAISIRRDPGVGNVISVQLATDASSVITTTGNLLVAGISGTKALATLTSNNTNVSDGDTVTLGSVTYRFKNTLAQLNDIKIGASADATLTSLAAVINGTGVAVTDMFTGTLQPHAQVSSSAVASHVLTITAKQAGTQFNAIPTSKSAATLTWSGATLGIGSGGSTTGVDPLSWPAYYMVTAANAAANDGTGLVTAVALAYLTGSTREPTSGYTSVAQANGEGWIFSGNVTSGAIVKPTPQNLHYGAAETIYEAKLRGVVGDNASGEEVQVTTSAASLLIACDLTVAQLARKGKLFDWNVAPWLDPATTNR